MDAQHLPAVPNPHGSAQPAQRPAHLKPQDIPLSLPRLGSKPEVVSDTQGGILTVMKIVVSDPEILAGTPVFCGTRVPVKTLTDYLEGGDTIDAFLDDFPTVRREQVIAFLEEARERMIAAVA